MRRGFTLVEILVVLGIIAVLAGILLPTFSTVRANGRSAACSSNLHQLGQAMELYTQDYDRYPRGLDPSDKYTPQIWNGQPIAGGNILTETPLLNTVMEPYIKQNELWHCPSDTGFDICDITGQPLNARPTCYQAFAMSYFYRTEITLLNLAQEHLARPAETNVLNDGNGGWHGTLFGRRRYNMLFADGHVKSVNLDGFNGAWATALR